MISIVGPTRVAVLPFYVRPIRMPFSIVRKAARGFSLLVYRSKDHDDDFFFFFLYVFSSSILLPRILELSRRMTICRSMTRVSFGGKTPSDQSSEMQRRERERVLATASYTVQHALRKFSGTMM